MNQAPGLSHQALQDYLAPITDTLPVEDRQRLFIGWIRRTFHVDFAESSVNNQVYWSPVDNLFGTLVFEFRSNLAQERESARSALTESIAGLKKSFPEAVFTGIATDGIHFILYAPIYLEGGTSIQSLDLVSEINLSESQEAMTMDRPYLWFELLLSGFLKQTTPASPEMISFTLGVPSACFRLIRLELDRLFYAAKDIPAVQLRFEEWTHCLALTYGPSVPDKQLFLNQTYLAILMRLLAFFYLEPSGHASKYPEGEDLIRGTYFRDHAGVVNLVEEDFFTWILEQPIKNPGSDLVYRIMQTLGHWSFSHLSRDSIDQLYQSLIEDDSHPSPVRQQNTEHQAKQVLQKDPGFSATPYTTLLDPYCGSGVFLTAAIQIAKKSLFEAGETPVGILNHIINAVTGLDFDPLAVTVARVNYLLTIGDILESSQEAITIPVYWCNYFDSGKVAEASETVNNLSLYEVPGREAPLAFKVPAGFAQNPSGFEYAVFRMKGQYLTALLRSRNRPEAERVIDAFHSFLVAPETTRKPFVLSQGEATIWVDTFWQIASFARYHADNFCFFLLVNSFQSAIVSHQSFDLIVLLPGDPLAPI